MVRDTCNTALLPGFPEPILDAQRTFRRLLDAMAHPGSIVRVDALPPAPAPFGPALAAVCLTLLDHETPIWSDLAVDSPALGWLRFHCGVTRSVTREAIRYAIVTRAQELTDLSEFACGDAERPEQSATVILEVGTLMAGTGMRLTGPGIRTEAFFDVKGVSEGFWEARRHQCREYPAGIDLIFCCGSHLAAIPRTTVVDTSVEL